jgi:3-deoxy-manno-octulosonate cytidylyltransferase (CMP-KDO synthetase)
MSMKSVGIIPARYSSSRFPGKPLALIHGKPMILWVCEQANLCSELERVVVATEDDRIYDTVANAGYEVVMTGSHHPSGTDRIAEAAQILALPKEAMVLNIQGDEPFIKPEQIVELSQQLNNQTVGIVTLASIIQNNDELTRISIPKVVLDSNRFALYFSRHSIPFLRPDSPMPADLVWYKHIGLYGFRNEVLQELVKLPLSALELAEGLEQLRWLYFGYKIKVGITKYTNHAIDTPEDLERINQMQPPY